MRKLKINLDELEYFKLEEAARSANMDLHDFVRLKLFDENPGINSVAEILKRIIKRRDYFLEPKFTLPEIYSEEWTITREKGAGSLGKRFLAFIKKYPQYGIRLVSNKRLQRRATYTLVEQSTVNRSMD